MQLAAPLLGVYGRLGKLLAALVGTSELFGGYRLGVTMAVHRPFGFHHLLTQHLEQLGQLSCP